MDCTEGCPTAASVMFGVPGVRVLAAMRDPVGLTLTVETVQTLEGCRRCGALAVAHDPDDVRTVPAVCPSAPSPRARPRPAGGRVADSGS